MSDQKAPEPSAPASEIADDEAGSDTEQASTAEIKRCRSCVGGWAMQISWGRGFCSVVGSESPTVLQFLPPKSAAVTDFKSLADLQVLPPKAQRVCVLVSPSLTFSPPLERAETTVRMNGEVLGLPSLLCNRDYLNLIFLSSFFRCA